MTLDELIEANREETLALPMQTRVGNILRKREELLQGYADLAKNVHDYLRGTYYVKKEVINGTEA